MKQTTFTFLLFAIVTLGACRKDQTQPTINEYDDDQIKSYISANGITGMQRDTSGIYYNITNPGTGAPIQYSDNISIVFSVRSVDGKYISTDTLNNHIQEFAGHISQISGPSIGVPGVQLAIHNILNHRGVVARIIVPSRLAYGVSGIGSGSAELTAGRIAGNQSLDCYIHIINNQAADAQHAADNQDTYDQASMIRYVANNSVTPAWQKDPAGFWYSISIPGTGTLPITDVSQIQMTYTATRLNGVVFDEYNSSVIPNTDIPQLVKGVQLALEKYATAGTLISIVIPSSLAYGNKSGSTAVPPNSCLRFDLLVHSVSQ